MARGLSKCGLLRQRKAVTLLELLLVVSVIGILAALIFPVFGTVRAKVELVRCTGQMRSIHASLASYLIDHDNVWPQPGVLTSTPAEDAFWLSTLKPFGAGDLKGWLCPTTLRTLRESGRKAESLHYLPSLFDAKPGTAFKWSNMPWLIEATDAHEKDGHLASYPDGSIRPFSLE